MQTFCYHRSCLLHTSVVTDTTNIHRRIKLHSGNVSYNHKCLTKQATRNKYRTASRKSYVARYTVQVLSAYGPSWANMGTAPKVQFDAARINIGTYIHVSSGDMQLKISLLWHPRLGVFIGNCSMGTSASAVADQKSSSSRLRSIERELFRPENRAERHEKKNA